MQPTNERRYLFLGQALRDNRLSHLSHLISSHLISSHLITSHLISSQECRSLRPAFPPARPMAGSSACSSCVRWWLRAGEPAWTPSRRTTASEPSRRSRRVDAVLGAGLCHSDDTVTVCGSTTIQVAGCLEGAACTKSNTIGPSQPALAGGLQVTAPCSQTLCDDCTVMMSRTAC